MTRVSQCKSLTNFACAGAQLAQGQGGRTRRGGKKARAVGGGWVLLLPQVRHARPRGFWRSGRAPRDWGDELGRVVVDQSLHD